MTFIDFYICNVAATLPVLNSMTLTYFFKVKYFNCQYLANGESQCKTARGDIYRLQRLPSNSIIANVVLFDLDLVFHVKYFKCKYLENGERQSKIAKHDICRFQNLPSNGIIANVRCARKLAFTYLFIVNSCQTGTS